MALPPLRLERAEGEQPPEAHPVRAERAAPSLAPGQPLGVRHHFTSTSIHGVPEVLTTYAPASDTHQVTFGTRGAWITLSTHGLEETAALAAALSRAADELLRKLDLPEAGEPLRMSGP